MKRLALMLLLFPSVVPCTSQAGADRVYPESAFLHAGQGGHLIDVTKAPFFARGDGLHDDTAALKMALRFAKEFTRAAHEPGGAVGGSPRRDSNWTVYLPKGTYLVSDTVSYGFLNLSGFNYLNWDPSDFPEAPVIQSLRSQYAIDGFFWKTQSAQPIVSRDLDGKGGVRERFAADFPKVEGENGFEVNIRSPEP